MKITKRYLAFFPVGAVVVVVAFLLGRYSTGFSPVTVIDGDGFSSIGTKPATVTELIDSKGLPTAVISRYSSRDEGDGFVLLLLYGVQSDFSKVARNKDGTPREHVLLFCDDRYFLSALRVHDESIAEPDFVGSTMYASRSSNGTRFELARITPTGEVVAVESLMANMARIDCEI